MHKLFSIFFCLSITWVNAQTTDKNANTWYFGNYAGITFNTPHPTDLPTALHGGQLFTNEACASYSNPLNGRIIFYTDGRFVWDSTHHLMPHGSGLLGRIDSEQGDIVPFPGHSGKYLLLTTTYWNGLNYSIVDMSLHSGKGDIDSTQKNILLLPDHKASDKVTFIRHSNKRDYWIVAKGSYTDSFFVYLLDSTGLHNADTIKIGSRDLTDPQRAGVLKFNRQGNILINCQENPSDLYNKSRLQAFSFNNSTGSISSVLFTIDSISFPYGIEFSPDNTKLYVSQPFSKRIIQYNLSSSNIRSSGITVFSSPDLSPGQLQIGPDNRIYVPYAIAYNFSYRYLGVISNPNASGTSCGFAQDGIDLSPGGTFLGLPYNVYDIPVDSSVNSCAYIDTFNCKTLSFLVDSSRFCVPILLYADTAGYRHNGFYFCVAYDTNFVNPSRIYTLPTDTSDFTYTIDSVVHGKICVSISNVHHITYTSNGEINLGCLQFVLHNDPFNADTTNYFDYLSFSIIDGCNNSLQVIDAWLTEDLDYWATEDNYYWKLEH